MQNVDYSPFTRKNWAEVHYCYCYSCRSFYVNRVQWYGIYTCVQHTQRTVVRMTVSQTLHCVIVIYRFRIWRACLHEDVLLILTFATMKWSTRFSWDHAHPQPLRVGYSPPCDGLITRDNNRTYRDTRTDWMPGTLATYDLSFKTERETPPPKESRART